MKSVASTLFAVVLFWWWMLLGAGGASTCDYLEEMSSVPSSSFRSWVLVVSVGTSWLSVNLLLTKTISMELDRIFFLSRHWSMTKFPCA